MFSSHDCGRLIQIDSHLRFQPHEADERNFEMANYLVRARPKPERLQELSQRLQRKAFVGLRPFGKALTHSLENARSESDGSAIWEEEDYCSPPLAEERAAVLDLYFDEIAVEPVKAGQGWEQIQALPKLNTKAER
jgi:hypothetical protein